MKLSGDLPTYLTRFQWDMAKYPIKQSLRNIADIISKQVQYIFFFMLMQLLKNSRFELKINFGLPME